MARHSHTPSPDDRALRGLRPVQAAPILEARTRAAGQAGTLVVLARQPRVPGPEVIQALCQGFGWDTWSTIRRLESPTPRIVRRELSDTAAQRWVGWLREMELGAFAVPETRLAEMRVHEAITLTKEGDGLVVAASDGTLHRVSADEALCMVQASVRSRTTRTVQSDGRVTREVVSDTTEGILDVHLRPGDTLVRFRQSVLRYADFLQSGETGSVAQFARVCAIIQESLPGVKCHVDFQAASGSLGDSLRFLSRSTDAIARSTGGQALALVETEESSEDHLFHLWSILLRFQAASAPHRTS